MDVSEMYRSEVQLSESETAAPVYVRLVTSTYFDVCISVIIVANAITIGTEQTFILEGKDTKAIVFVEQVFLSVFIVEIVLRVMAFGKGIFRDTWVQFDALLVITGVASSWVFPMLGIAYDNIGPILTLRITRLLRLAKSIRFLIRFRELWMLVRGLLNSASTMCYTLLLLLLVMYIFAAMGMEFITKNKHAVGADADPMFQKIVDENFSSLPIIMLTLFRFVTVDGPSSLYGPLVKKDVFLGFYFLLLFLVVSIVLMNLITAVIVNSALEATMQDKELKAALAKDQRQRHRKEMKSLFQRLDEDNSGEITLEEIGRISAEDLHNLGKITAVVEPREIFHMLDVDGSGVVGIDEFCDSMWHIASETGSLLRMQRVEKLTQSIRRRQDRNDKVLQDIGKGIQSIQKALGLDADELVIPESPRCSSTSIQVAANLGRPENWPDWEKEARDLQNTMSHQIMELQNMLEHMSDRTFRPSQTSTSSNQITSSSTNHTPSNVVSAGGEKKVQFDDNLETLVNCTSNEGKAGDGALQCEDSSAPKPDIPSSLSHRIILRGL